MKNPSAAKNEVMSMVLLNRFVLLLMIKRLSSAMKQTALRNPHPAFLLLKAGINATNPTKSSPSRSSASRINPNPDNLKMVNVDPRKTMSRITSMRKKLNFDFPILFF